MKIFHFFLFSSLYISICAVLMVFQTYHLLFHTPPSCTLVTFVFFATICSYNFHGYLTAFSVASSLRARWTRQHRTVHLILYITGLTGSLIYFFLLRKHWMALTFAGFITFLYSAPKLPQTLFKQLREVAFGKTIFLALVWTFVTTILPVFVSGNALQMVHVLFACSRFFLIYPICIIFDYRDREDDRNEGIRSMITYMSEKGVNFLFFISILLFMLLTSMLIFFNFSIPSIIILMIPGIMVASLYNYSKKNFSDYLYYFVLDGLMMFSSLLMLVFKI
jgi:4-hydroxybenzoate polyprenyltransferase